MSWIWIVLIDILLIIIVALFLSVTVKVRLTSEADIKIKYAGITILTIRQETPEEKAAAEKKKAERPERVEKAKAKQAKKQAAKEKKKARKKAEEKPKKTLEENLELVKALLYGISKPAKRLFSHIRVTNVKADITMSGDDAAAAALNYGRMSLLISSVLSLLYCTVRLSVDNIELGVDFQSGKTVYDIGFKVKLRISTALGCALWFLFRTARKMLAQRKSKGGVAPKKGN